MICATQFATLPSGFRDIVPDRLGGADNGQVQPLAFERKSLFMPCHTDEERASKRVVCVAVELGPACYQASAAARRWQESDPSSTEHQHGNWKRYKGG